MISPSLSSFYKVLPPNMKGKDYVIGDLHGCLDLLERTLEQVSFDTSCDRLFSVGDLINRGPQPLECLKLLELSWFHAVLGNHEGMLLSWADARQASYHNAYSFLANGGLWVAHLSSKDKSYLLDQIVPLVVQLPFVIHVEDALRPFNVLHAEALSADGATMLRQADLAEMTLTGEESGLLWGRTLRKQAAHSSEDSSRKVLGIEVSPQPWEPDLDLTYVGHTVVKAPLLHRSHVFLDCGAYMHAVGRGYLHTVCHQDFAAGLRDLAPA